MIKVLTHTETLLNFKDTKHKVLELKIKKRKGVHFYF